MPMLPALRSLTVCLLIEAMTDYSAYDRPKRTHQ